jgi:hypothetical protein
MTCHIFESDLIFKVLMFWPACVYDPGQIIISIIYILKTFDDLSKW